MNIEDDPQFKALRHQYESTLSENTKLNRIVDEKNELIDNLENKLELYDSKIHFLQQIAHKRTVMLAVVNDEIELRERLAGIELRLKELDQV